MTVLFVKSSVKHPLINNGQRVVLYNVWGGGYSEGRKILLLAPNTTALPLMGLKLAIL